jgi:DNA (cytosine-5)-methyltransferase 1
MAAYYNEFDPYAAQWLRNLIAAGLIAAGDVDQRSILEVRPDDLKGYTQCHFFAGIGLWSEALHQAGWPDDESVWTGSCPCQPLSGAGQRKGHADERHLWPAFYGLIAECRPATVFGEQVASADGREWLAGVRADLEALGYACGAADLCAAGVGAPHIRQRLYWVADADGGNACAQRLQRSWQHGQQPQDGRSLEGLVDASGVRRERREGTAARHQHHGEASRRPQSEHGPVGAVEDRAAGLGNTEGERLQGEWGEYCPSGERHRGLVGLAMQAGVPQWNGPTIAVKCSDGARRVSAQPDAFPLGHGVKGRMGRLRAYGNAIVPQVAAEFIRACSQIG